MTMPELIQRMHETGKWPEVQIDKKLNHMASNKGRVSQIKPTGVAVNFGGPYEPWFWALEGKDERRKYMKDLTFVEK